VSTVDEASPWTDSFNMAVLGGTQTGKTSTVRELHATTPRVSVWLNERGDDAVPGVAGPTVRSLDGVRQAFADDEFSIDFRPADRRDSVVELQSWLETVADRADRELPIQVVADEFQRLAPQSGKPFGEFPARDAVRRFAKEGVKRNVKWVGITQDPTAIDKQTLRQSEYRLIFKMSQENRTSSVVRRMGIDWGAVDEGDRYTGALFRDDGSLVDDDVKADGRFA
jgi:hypothetical protein